MLPSKPFALTATLSLSLLLSACVVAPGMTEQEKGLRDDMNSASYIPAPREMRDNIETQELFAQAAFWSREYELNPSDLEATIKLASAVRKMGNAQRAIEITQIGRSLYPRDPYLGAEYAASLIAAERAQEAIPVLDEMLNAAPAYARLWSLKGAALDQAEQYDLARKHYARALQITPNDPNVLTNVGLSYALSGDPQTAEGWLRRAAAIPGASDTVKQNLALVLQLQGKTPETEKPSSYAQPNTQRRLDVPSQPAPRQIPANQPSAPQANYSVPTAMPKHSVLDKIAANIQPSRPHTVPAQNYPQAQNQYGYPQAHMTQRADPAATGRQAARRRR